MPNLIETIDQLKGLSDQQLLGASHNPPPNTPGWLILSEMERRKTTRQQFQGQQQQMQAQKPPVMQQLQQQLGGASQGIPGQMTPQAPSPVATGAGIPPMPQTPKLMRRGGLMRRADGGETDEEYDTTDPSMGETQAAPSGGSNVAIAMPFIGGKAAAAATPAAPQEMRLSERLRSEAPSAKALKGYVAMVNDAAGGAPNYSAQQQLLAQQLLHIQQQKPRLGDYLIRAGAAMSASPSHFLGQAAGQGLMSALDYSDKQKEHKQSEIARILNEQIALSRLEQGDRRDVGREALGMWRGDTAARNQALRDATTQEYRENQDLTNNRKLDQQSLLAQMKQNALDKKEAQRPPQEYYGAIDEAFPVNASAHLKEAYAQAKQGLRAMVDMEIAQGAPHSQIQKTISDGIKQVMGSALSVAGKQDTVHVSVNGMNPGAASTTAQAIIDGKVSPTSYTALLRKNPNLVNEIQGLDPSWSEEKLKNKYNTLQEFTSTSNTKAGGQLIALNTLIHHADLYNEVADALKNGQWRVGNALYNKVSTAFGSAAPPNANQVMQFMAAESAKLATGGVPAQSEIHSILSNIDTNGSPDQLRGAADTTLQVAVGKAIPLMERVKKVGLENSIDIIGPDAAEILKKRGIDPATLKKAAQQAATPAGGYMVGDSVMYQGKPHKITAIKPNGKLVLEQ